MRRKEREQKMNVRKQKLPIGIENFQEIRTQGFYYIDKTGLIKELLENPGKVTLFTRPRRFGKSLNMSMLKCFFDPNSDKSAFEGVKISKETALCEQYMGKFPVISISLKGIHASSFESARDMAVNMINEAASQMQDLLDSEHLTSYDKERFLQLLRSDMNEAVLCNSLREMSRLLQKHYGQKAVILIDEYDVPLAKAFNYGYYDKMIVLIRNLLEQALKTNENLQFAVLTGCMRISKESIFTGLNNLKVLTVADVRFDEYFGFTDEEVRNLLEYYGLSFQYDTVKEWYDGYQFGNIRVYCPWDVINYCDALRTDRDAYPQNYWSNTSSNDAVRRFIEEAASETTKREIEKLVAGETIMKEIHQELTYKDMYDSIENIWSVLFMTGYLTQRGKPQKKEFCLAIPNMEIREIYTEQIMAFFKANLRKNGSAVEGFCTALKNGNAEDVEKRFNEYLRRTISIRDTFVKKSLKENFYHGIILGLLGYQDTWIVSSNKESGEGYSDILAEIPEEGIGIIIEMKYCEDGDLEAGCRKALKQIETKHYEEIFYDEDIEHILKYGVVCYKKRCKVLLER